MRREADLWWRQAQRDMRTAENCHQAKDYYAAVFFCHQTLEKALKSVIVQKRKVVPPRTHSLKELGEEADVPRTFRRFLRDLTPDYFTTRYPDIAGGVTADLYDGNASRKILRQTEEVLEWAEEQL